MVDGSNLYTLFPKSREDLIYFIDAEIRKHGNAADLNHIDVSKVEDFSGVFAWTHFCGDISKWDVSNARTMAGMMNV